MATLKKSSKKKKIIIAVAVLLVLAIIVTSVVIYSVNNSKESVSLYTISTSDIYETVSATGDVTSGATREYSVSSIATVKEVFVSEGDEVKEGDILATFDTSTLDSEIESLQNTYNKAKSSYNEALSSQSTAKSNLSDIEDQIAAVEKQISKLDASQSTTTTAKKTTTTTTEAKTYKFTTNADITTNSADYSTLTTISEDDLYNQISSLLSTTQATSTTADSATTAQSTTAQQTTADSSTSTTLSAEEILSQISSMLESTTTTTTTESTTASADDIAQQISSLLAADSSNSSSDSVSLSDIVTSINSLITTINGLSSDLETANQMLQIVMQVISSELSSLATNGIDGTFVDDLATAVGDAVSDAITTGIIDETKLLVDSVDAVALIEAAVKSIDWEALAEQTASVVSENDTVELASLELRLAALYIQKELYTVAASDSTVEAQKEILDAAQTALDSLKESSSELSAGWTAAFDGTITECAITPGEQVSLLSSCITLQNLDSMVVTISLNEYDIHKVSVGMDCTITTAYGEYTGTVTNKALVATGGSSSSIIDSLGSIAGISGLSSLTDTGAGVEVQITVDNPDDNIIIGFEANVEIAVGEYIDVTSVPIESLLLEKTGTYVYLYDEEEGTVTKTAVTTGAISDSVYQVTDGLSVGDKIVATPSSSYDDETFEVKVSNSAS
ncbi:MAG: biotin/lipoyl-binding protein [Clostridiales bacterium]|nr:biotin/lipoyl-binding protein [Clostridiales bacterium]